MNIFDTISTKFYTELRNGEDFLSNPTDFTNTLVGNVQEKTQVIKVIQVSTSVKAIDHGTFEYTPQPSKGKFVFTGDWFNESIGVGATIDITWSNGTLTASETVLNITGANNTTLITTKVNLDLQGLTVQEVRDDFIIKVTSAPNRIKYKYGLNQLTATVNNYISPFDNNEQAYYLNNITGSYQTLNRIGNDVSWDLGQVEVKFNGTTSGYIHEFEVKHTFKTPYFVDGQQNNITSLLTPNELVGANSFKYGFGLFLAESDTNYNRVLEDIGLNGSVGYFNENFNGFVNNYEIQDIVYTNDHGTETIEGTDTTTIEFDIKKNNGNWTAGESFVLKHSKLPTALEYQNKTQSFDEIWIIESAETTEGASPVNQTIIQDFAISITTPSVVHVNLDIEYSAAQQLLISEDKDWLLTMLVSDGSLVPNDVDRVTLKIDSNNWGFDNDVTGLVQGNELNFFNSAASPIPTDFIGNFSSFNGWDGDFVGLAFKFQTKALNQVQLLGARFKIIAQKSSNEFVLSTVIIPIPAYQFFDSVIPSNNHRYQICNVDQQNEYNITSSESFNRIVLNSFFPSVDTDFQDWIGTLAFKVGWREWLENLNVPNEFYDPAEPQNNQNLKVSNYSNLLGYNIRGVIELDVAETGRSVFGEPITTYQLRADTSLIHDFDVDGGTGFTGVSTYYDENGDVTDDIFINENVRIEIEFNHSSGTLVKLWGEVWIEPKNTSNQEWRLHSEKDWTNPLNPLQPTDTLATGNVTLVEVISINNKATIICQTNRDNLVNGTEYNIYGRLGTT